MPQDPIEIGSTGGTRIRGSLARPSGTPAPGILLLHESGPQAQAIGDLYAEEGYLVLTPDLPADAPAGAVADCIAALRARPEHSGGVGLLGVGAGGGLAWRAAASGGADCAVIYDPPATVAAPAAASAACPLVAQLAEQDGPAPQDIRAALAGWPQAELFTYPGCRPGFASEGNAAFDKPASLMAHTRALTLFRRIMGPHYDLAALWERHTALEFAARDADATMTTMVAEPYVNHIPTMTGGVGYTQLLRFYKHHFIPTTPADAQLIPVSRTIGVDRLVDEFVFAFTHDREIDWLLPGVPPTGRRIEVPTLAVVRFRGDKLYNEHIYWDQASVLVQAGLLDPKLLPVAGVETARKLLDESLPSNTLMRRWRESAPA